MPAVHALTPTTPSFCGDLLDILGRVSEMATIVLAGTALGAPLPIGLPAPIHTAPAQQWPQL
jgi:hypothetical protein